jgi:hypothetical protein
MALAHPGLARPDRLIDRLARRNRIVAVLRLAVPLLGVLLFVLLVGQIWLANLASQYGIAGIAIDRGHLVVETPQYTATMADGTRFIVNAGQARVSVDRSDEVELVDATLVYDRPGRPAMYAASDSALLESARQTVEVPGVATVSSEDGLSGTLTAVRANLDTQITRADGAVDLTLPDATTIVADNMVFDGKTQVWTFEHATVVIPQLPEPEP